MQPFPIKDAGAFMGSVFALASNATPGTAGTGAPKVIVAASADDDTKIIGETINRMTYGMPVAGVLEISTYYSLADTETLSLAVEIQESADGSAWDTAVALQAETVLVTASGATVGGTKHSTKLFLGDRKQYIRFNVTPDLSAGATDTASLSANLLMFGAWSSKLLPAHDANDEG